MLLLTACFDTFLSAACSDALRAARCIALCDVMPPQHKLACVASILPLFHSRTCSVITQTFYLYLLLRSIRIHPRSIRSTPRPVLCLRAA